MTYTNPEVAAKLINLIENLTIPFGNFEKDDYHTPSTHMLKKAFDVLYDQLDKIAATNVYINENDDTTILDEIGDYKELYKEAVHVSYMIEQELKERENYQLELLERQLYVLSCIYSSL